MEIDNEREGAAEPTKLERRVGKERWRGGRKRRRRQRHEDRCCCQPQNTCNASIDRRNQLLTAAGEGRGGEGLLSHQKRPAKPARRGINGQGVTGDRAGESAGFPGREVTGSKPH